MKIVQLSALAEKNLDDYFYNYKVLEYETDMPKRALTYSKIINYLAHIDLFLDKVFMINNSNFINIENICRVRYAEFGDKILIKEIYFNE
jgi:hypothetical protein